MQHRLEKLRRVLKEAGVDAIISGDAVHRRYISGFTGSAGWILVSQNEAKLLTDFRYVEQAAQQAPQFAVIDHQRKEKEALFRELTAMGVKRLAFEKQLVSYAVYEEWREAFPGVELVPVSGIFERLRAVKDEAELANVREAARIADAAFEHILSFIRPGVRERDVALELEMFMRRQGASAAAFDIIVASGARGALPHGVASDKVIEQGDMVTLDFGAVYQGYCSDITRTVAVGEPDAKLKEIYAIVLNAQQQTVAAIKPGITGKEADAVARNIIAEAGYGDAFGHSTGHGFGLQVHEEPRLSAAGLEPLEPGMLVTVEPGIYLPGLGGVRIEDDVLVTDNGGEILTKSTKELLILPV